MHGSLSYPIGEHTPQASYSAAERTALIARLAAQPAALAAALSGLNEPALARAYRPGGWTVRQLVHHVADSHINMFLRVKFALSDDEPTIKPYDQDRWVQQGDVAAVAPMVSVALLASLHERLVALLQSLSPEQFARGLIHPENGRMSIEQVLALYAWHGDHHVAHIRAFREREGL
ncbi:MAG: putative metal-dependent hydrolase [Gemmatimonadaceae bacterium]|nr:putative metal-dependent hydrolase [Gemmatimonadaceae bacterium]